jgi:hypothetical protein
MQTAAQPGIEHRGIARPARTPARRRRGQASGHVQLICTGAQLDVRVANAAGRERELAGSGERTSAQSAVAAELERNRGRPGRPERALRACLAGKRCDRIVAETRRIERCRGYVYLEGSGARHGEARCALERAAADLCAEGADVDDAARDGGTEGERHIGLL